MHGRKDGGKYSASLSASMNMMGQFGGAIGPIAVAQILKYTGNNWTATFLGLAPECISSAQPPGSLSTPVTPLAGPIEQRRK